MEAVMVDGMNLLDCYSAMADAVAVRRKKPKPLLIEAKTYRYRGHSISDPATYRKKDEIVRYQHIDPISQIRGLMAENGWLDEVQAKELEREVRNEVVDAVNFADESLPSDVAERGQHVYAE
jgi:pyruvate dehydrogenase E1 component alpha subunit